MKPHPFSILDKKNTVQKENDIPVSKLTNVTLGTPVLCETSANETIMPPKTADINNHANQLNPNSSANKAASDNHANQLNPNHANQLNPNHAASKGGGK